MSKNETKFVDFETTIEEMNKNKPFFKPNKNYLKNSYFTNYKNKLQMNEKKVLIKAGFTTTTTSVAGAKLVALAPTLMTIGIALVAAGAVVKLLREKGQRQSRAKSQPASSPHTKCSMESKKWISGTCSIVTRCLMARALRILVL